jgi:glutamate 5-kinase
VAQLTPEIFALAGEKGSDLACGGMATKLNAARTALESGFDMVISNGSRPEDLYDIVEGKPIGTRFIGKTVI